MCTLDSGLLLIIQIIGMADDCKGEVKKKVPLKRNTSDNIW